MAIGILGVGVYLPDNVRSNDWWPRESVEKWPKKMAAILGRDPKDFGFPITDGVRKAIDGLRAFVDDPFFGIKERRVMPDGMTPSEMEIRAAREAIRSAGIDPKEIGIVLAHSMVPTYLTFNQATPIHHELGLSSNCLCTGVDAVCNSFVVQLSMAADMLQAGRARYALLVQSSAVSRIQDNEDWSSAFLGDGAGAVVLGPVADGRGVLATAHRTDSRNHLGIVTGLQDQPWHADGKNVAFVIDKAATRRTFFQTNDLAIEVLKEAFERAGVAPEQIGFYACHQVAGNMRKQTQELVGMTHARAIDTLPWAGTLSSANIALQLATAEKDSPIQPDELVAMFSMGAGSTVSAAVLRWGR